MPRRAAASVKTIGEALEDLIGKLGIKKKLREYEAVLRWEEIVGGQIARVSSARKISEGILVVEVKASVWRNELNMRKQEIVQRLNAALGEDVVVDIKFH